MCQRPRPGDEQTDLQFAASRCCPAVLAALSRSPLRSIVAPTCHDKAPLPLGPLLMAHDVADTATATEARLVPASLDQLLILTELDAEPRYCSLGAAPVLDCHAAPAGSDNFAGSQASTTSGAWV